MSGTLAGTSGSAIKSISFGTGVIGTNQNFIFDDIVATSNPSAFLPVELTTFDIKANVRDIMLNWETAMEINNSHFDIEKSIDGKQFEKIGVVEGHGSTLEQQTYRFIDENPNNGLNYYRLKQVDFDGTFEYSKIVVTEFKKAKQVSFYPNPVRDQLFIQSGTDNQMNIHIYNMQGQLVKQFNAMNLNEQFRLNVNDLTTGLYQIQLLDANSNAILEQHRMIKQ